MTRVAFLHYHLRPGGVTRVIELAVQALEEAGWDPLVISGEPVDRSCRIAPRRIAVVEALRYGSKDSEGICDGVERACRNFWSCDADILHIHNHALGKNTALPDAVARWSADGRALVLQMHDFAENGRPANYRLLSEAFGGPSGLSRMLYPSSPRQAPVVLSSHAADCLRRCGACPTVLPNPVVVPVSQGPVLPAELGGDSMVVYPTRGIRRKNLGEFLLHSAGASHAEIFVITSAPAPGPARDAYDEWKTFARQNGLPVVFDAAAELGRSVYDFLPAAKVCATTSVEEGFGMAFLEPWVAGTPVAGRDLPCVTRDFREAGITLPGLTASLPVPTRLIDEPRMLRLIDHAVHSTLAAYGRSGTGTDSPFARGVRAARAAVFDAGTVDFGRLDETEQRRVITSLIRDGACTPWRQDAGSGDVDRNQRLIRARYSLSAYALQLMDIYRSTLNAAAGDAGFLDAPAMLDALLDFSDFSALRFDPANS